MRILLVSDSHLGRGAARYASNWAAVRRFAAAARPDLTVHLGDITLHGIGEPDDLRYALDASRQWPTAICFLPGNHDVGDNPPGPGVPSSHPLDARRLREYRDLFGPDRWCMTADRWSIIGLDAQLFGTDTDEEAEQWRWLSSRIAEIGRRPVAVMLHKPLFQNDVQDEAPHIRYVPAKPRRQLLHALALLDVRVVASGHTHQYRNRIVDDVRHVWVPSSAFVFPDTLQERIGEKIVGLGLLELTESGHRFEVVVPEDMTQLAYEGEAATGPTTARAAVR